MLPTRLSSAKITQQPQPHGCSWQVEATGGCLRASAVQGCTVERPASSTGTGHRFRWRCSTGPQGLVRAGRDRPFPGQRRPVGALIKSPRDLSEGQTAAPPRIRAPQADLPVQQTPISNGCAAANQPISAPIRQRWQRERLALDGHHHLLRLNALKGDLRGNTIPLTGIAAVNPHPALGTIGALEMLRERQRRHQLLKLHRHGAEQWCRGGCLLGG